MGKLGGGVVLLVVGAIFTFALNITIPGIGKDALGIILMIGGVLAIALWFVTENASRHSRTVVSNQPYADEAVPVDEVVDPPVRRRRRYL